MSDVCAVLALYFPLTQSVHAADDDAVALNLPAAQAATLEPDPVYPASALQSSTASDPAGLPEFVGQSEHEVVPYLSAAQVTERENVYVPVALGHPSV